MEAKTDLKKIENMMYFDPLETEKWYPYRDSDDYVTYIDEEEGVVKVTKKFKEEDWNKMDDFLNTHPLFNNEYTEADLETNEYLQALHAMKQDINAEQTMEKFYKEGNKYMQEKLLNLPKG
jgi:tetratricopeptide (TPR) repeat protein